MLLEGSEGPQAFWCPEALWWHVLQRETPAHSCQHKLKAAGGSGAGKASRERCSADVPNSWSTTRVPQLCPAPCSLLHPPGVPRELISSIFPRGILLDSHESLSPASRMTMKMEILEGFLLALLTQLNAYNIITKGEKKDVFRGKKKKYNPNKKNFTEAKQTTHISGNYLWWNWLLGSSKLQGSGCLCPQK